jgi:hypothetical protein
VNYKARRASEERKGKSVRENHTKNTATDWSGRQFSPISGLLASGDALESEHVPRKKANDGRAKLGTRALEAAPNTEKHRMPGSSILLEVDRTLKLLPYVFQKTAIILVWRISKSNSRAFHS